MKKETGNAIPELFVGHIAREIREDEFTQAFRKFGGSFWKMTQSLSKRGLAWFVPTQVRSGFRDTQRK